MRGIVEHVRWGREVERAAWDETSARRQVTVRDRDGARETVLASAVITGIEILSRPLIPDLPGMDRFTASVFHSAQWDHSVDLRGERVALIGAGASGFQIGPQVRGCHRIDP